MGGNQRKLILASQSPRRRELLEQLRIDFEVVTPDFVEMTRPDLTPEQEVGILAKGKAESLQAQFPNAAILGCDTLVVTGGKKLGKPAGESDALRMLLELSGQIHQVLTALHLIDVVTAKSWSAMEETKVKMRKFSEQDARAYIATGEPLDKAGAYGIQGEGGLLVESIEGDFYNVVGLPLKALAKLLENVDIKINLKLVPDPKIGNWRDNS